MKLSHQYHNDVLDASIRLVFGSAIPAALNQVEGNLYFLINLKTEALLLQADGEQFALPSQAVLCGSHGYFVKAINEDQLTTEVALLSFNRAFYCIHTHDAEVNCNGLLFFNAQETPILKLSGTEGAKLSLLLDDLQEEFMLEDRNQEVMLRVLLKRFIIKCTRLARQQFANGLANDQQQDILREFAVLVEQNFKTHHLVADYADMLHRSPKTVQNIFAKAGGKSPLQIIHDRLALEAKRLLLYTDKSAKEICIELGFEEQAQFSRFFKKMTGLSTTEFKEKHLQIYDGAN